MNTPAHQRLPFEKPSAELADRLDALRAVAGDQPEVAEALERFSQVGEQLEDRLIDDLGRWEKVQISRHPNRPYTLDYIAGICDDFFELHGDRHYADDGALIGGLARIGERNVMWIGTQKGKSTAENVQRNFGMPRPEGYRKALRLMRLAERFNLPIVTTIDTPGAYPGIGAEERGQAEAIAFNLEAMMSLTVPVVCTVIGEGGSGGALAIGVGNKVLMFEYSVYSVISPEAASAILYRVQGKNKEAAQALRPTAADLLKLEVIDAIIPEPRGGAHRDHEQAASNLRAAIESALDELSALSPGELVAQRIDRFRRLGQVVEG
jgi:acetyl-CoA carboxylase carboxyl transferase subunit alpha